MTRSESSVASQKSDEKALQQPHEASESSPVCLVRPKRSSFASTSKLFQKFLENPVQAFATSCRSFHDKSCSNPPPQVDTDTPQAEIAPEPFTLPQYDELEYVDLEQADAQELLQKSLRRRSRRRDISLNRTSQEEKHRSSSHTRLRRSSRSFESRSKSSSPSRSTSRSPPRNSSKRAGSIRVLRTRSTTRSGDSSRSRLPPNREQGRTSPPRGAKSTRPPRRDLLNKQRSQSSRQLSGSKNEVLISLDRKAEGETRLDGCLSRGFERAGSMRDLRQRGGLASVGSSRRELLRKQGSKSFRQRRVSTTQESLDAISKAAEAVQASEAKDTTTAVGTAAGAVRSSSADQVAPEKSNTAADTKAVVTPSCVGHAATTAYGWECLCCGDTNKTQHTFCGLCGASKGTQPTVWECKVCNTKDNEGRHAYCGGCGSHWMKKATSSNSLTKNAPEAA